MRKGIKKLVAVACVLTMGLSLVACGGNSAGEDTTAAVTEGSGTEDSGEKEKYAVVLKVLSSPFWQSMQQGIEEKAEELGVEVEILAANSEDDVEGQVSIVENVISKGYKGIAVAPLSADNLVSVIAEANEKGILVADIDEKVNLEALEAAGGSVLSFVTTDNKAVGKMAGEFIAETIGSGEVAIIEGKAGNASGEDRKNGCNEAFEAAGLNVVDSQPADWDRTKAYDLATNLINKYSDLKAIYCCNDTMELCKNNMQLLHWKDCVIPLPTNLLFFDI